jgi:hypothetical protein
MDYSNNAILPCISPILTDARSIALLVFSRHRGGIDESPQMPAHTNYRIDESEFAPS